MNTVPDSRNYAKIIAQYTGYPMYSEMAWKNLSQTGTSKEWSEQVHIPFVEMESCSRYGSDWQKLKPALEECLITLNAAQLKAQTG